MEEINNKTIIRNISFDQTEILYNIMRLYNNGEPFECDITASELKFYQKNKQNKYDIPIPKILMDVCPQREDIIKITPFQKLPLEDNSLQSIVVDLPFVVSPRNTPSKTINIREGNNLISNRFSSFYPADELFENIYWWIKECYRVLKDDGICVWKMQSTVSGGRECWSSPFSFMVADKVGFYVEDEFILEAKARIVATSHFPNGQQHARKYTSTFWVFKKDDKLAMKNSCFRWLELCEMQELEGKVWSDNKQNKELNNVLDTKYSEGKNIKKARRKRQNKKTPKEEKKNVNMVNAIQPTIIFYDKKGQVIDTINTTEFVKDGTVKDVGAVLIKTPKKRGRKSYEILQYNKNGDFIRLWTSLDEIQSKLGYSKASISQCVNGKIRTSGGFVWRRKNDNTEVNRTLQ